MKRGGILQADDIEIGALVAIHSVDFYDPFAMDGSLTWKPDGYSPLCALPLLVIGITLPYVRALKVGTPGNLFLDVRHLTLMRYGLDMLTDPERAWLLKMLLDLKAAGLIQQAEPANPFKEA
jgi:hypothetical protein